MKPRILFVDDEPDVLAGLRRTLSHRRADWDLQFVASGAECLVRLEEGPCAVIVTDIRMPEMDGAELLQEVQRTHPGIVRVALSGETAREQALRAMGAAHQFLAKPCGPAALERALGDALALRSLVSDSRLQALLGRVGNLPSVPAVYRELTSELESELASPQSIGDIVARDPGLTARVLHIANSAFFGLAHPVTTPRDAVLYIGVEVLRMLVLTDQAFACVAADPVPGLSSARVMDHSLAVAHAARLLARRDGARRAECDATFCAGLLHDLGKLIVAEACPALYVECLERVAREGISLHAAELAVFDATHAAVAGYLFGVWGLPPVLFEGVAGHHSIVDELATGAVEADELPESGRVALRVHVADLVEHLRDTGGGCRAAEGGLRLLSQTAAAGRVADWQAVLAEAGSDRAAA